MPGRVAVHGDWRPIRDAVQYAYEQQGIAKTESIPDAEWNLAVLVYQYAMERSVSCAHCQKLQHMMAVYRCFDCKAPLCEQCAPAHFGPDHAKRAALAHP